MKTFIYMLRHCDSLKTGNEKDRGLTEKGVTDAQRLIKILQEENINTVISSPYTRSVLTVQPLAEHIGQNVVIIENLKERVFSPEKNRLSDNELQCLLEKSFEEPDFTLKGGESNNECQRRGIDALKSILHTFKGQKIVVGTHGAVMTLMMGYFDNSYGLDFLLSTSKPDIYRMEFNELELIDVTKIWK